LAIASTRPQPAADVAAQPSSRAAWLLVGVLWVCYLLNHADRQVVYTLFPELQREFGFTDTTLGLLGALFLWVYGLFSPFAGLLGDRISKTRLIAGSLVIWSSLTVLSGLAPNGGFLLACRGLLGIAESLFMPAGYVLMANAHPPQNRSKALAIFGTSQMVGIAAGGSLSGFVAEHFHWRASFFLLGGAGLVFAVPLMLFFRRVPAYFHSQGPAQPPARFSSVPLLFAIPSLRVVIGFVTVAAFGMSLVHTWLPTFLYDKFRLGLAAAGFEASVYPQVGTVLGLLAGGSLADRLARRTTAARFWTVLVAFFSVAPCIFLLGQTGTLAAARAASLGFGFFAGFIAVNQALASFDVVPGAYRATTVGLLNLVGCCVAGFAPFFGGLARNTVGVDQLMSFAASLYLLTGFAVLYVILRHFDRDHRRAEAQSV
jgi:predicted MFS family arabinose efflux permease